MEQQTPIPPIKDEAELSRAKGKTRHFPILDLGEGGRGSRFSICFVQDCSPTVLAAQVRALATVLDKINGKPRPPPPPPPPNQGWENCAFWLLRDFILDLGGGGGGGWGFAVPFYFVQDCRLRYLTVVVKYQL